MTVLGWPCETFPWRSWYGRRWCEVTIRSEISLCCRLAFILSSFLPPFVFSPEIKSHVSLYLCLSVFHFVFSLFSCRLSLKRLSVFSSFVFAWGVIKMMMNSPFGCRRFWLSAAVCAPAVSLSLCHTRTGSVPNHTALPTEVEPHKWLIWKGLQKRHMQLRLKLGYYAVITW